MLFFFYFKISVIQTEVNYSLLWNISGHLFFCQRKCELRSQEWTKWNFAQAEKLEHHLFLIHWYTGIGSFNFYLFVCLFILYEWIPDFMYWDQGTSGWCIRLSFQSGSHTFGVMHRQADPLELRIPLLSLTVYCEYTLLSWMKDAESNWCDSVHSHRFSQPYTS